MRIGIQKLKPPQAAEKTSIDVNSKTLREKEKSHASICTCMALLWWSVLDSNQ